MARFSRAYVSSALAITLVAIACSPPNVAASNAAAACTDYAYAYCTHLQTCSPTVLALRYPDFASCRSLIGQTCIVGVTAPSTTEAPGTHEDCANAIATWACEDFLDTINAPPACTFSPGSLSIGAACGVDGQCASGYCGVPIGSACGACADISAANCSTFTTCPRGEACLSGTCSQYATIGQACGTTVTCTYGLGCIAGKCVTVVSTVGAACDLTTGPPCDQAVGLVCNSTSKQCETEVLAPDGASCATAQGQAVACLAGSRCTNNVCSVVSPLGGPCDLVAGPTCGSPAHCVVTGGVASDAATAGTCTVLDGSTCH